VLNDVAGGELGSECADGEEHATKKGNREDFTGDARSRLDIMVV
jgi:hypothetical protein